MQKKIDPEAAEDGFIKDTIDSLNALKPALTEIENLLIDIQHTDTTWQDDMTLAMMNLSAEIYGPQIANTRLDDHEDLKDTFKESKRLNTDIHNQAVTLYNNLSGFCVECIFLPSSPFSLSLPIQIPISQTLLSCLLSFKYFIVL